jgi:hypothetical protein
MQPANVAQDLVASDAIEILRTCMTQSLTHTQEMREFVTNYLERAGRVVEHLPGGCVFSPGTREDAIVVVAHMDTVWANRSRTSVIADIDEHEGVWHSRNRAVGIGADDRSGIGAIFNLLDLGHSVLFTDGEERGMVGSITLRRSEHQTFELLQQHSFMLQIDRMGVNDFKCYDVGTDDFRDYVQENTGMLEPNRSSFTDICTLCRDIPGVNVSIGYYNEHSPHEVLVLDEWLHQVQRIRTWLSRPTPRFLLPQQVTSRAEMFAGGW